MRLALDLGAGFPAEERGGGAVAADLETDGAAGTAGGAVEAAYATGVVDIAAHNLDAACAAFILAETAGVAEVAVDLKPIERVAADLPHGVSDRAIGSAELASAPERERSDEDEGDNSGHNACGGSEPHFDPGLLRHRGAEDTDDVARDVPGLDQQGDHPDADQKADQVDPEDMDRGARLRAIAEGAVEACLLYTSPSPRD